MDMVLAKKEDVAHERQSFGSFDYDCRKNPRTHLHHPKIIRWGKFPVVDARLWDENQALENILPEDNKFVFKVNQYKKIT